MARATNADQELLRLSGGDLYGSSFERVVWHAERTFYNTLAVAKWHMSRRVNACGYKVVVTGEGADELFGGYPALKRDMLLHATSEAERQSLLRELERSNKVFRGAILAETAARHAAFDDIVGFTPSWIQPWISALEEVRPLLAEPLREELADYDPIAAIAKSFDTSRLRGRHPLDKAQYTWIKTMLEGQILTWGGDRVDMAHSMESRPAFLDHHLAETAFRVPPRLRIRGNTEKWVLREAMRHVLPRVLYERQKFAFMAPPSHTDDAKREAAADLIARHLSRDRVAAAGLFDGKRVEDFIARIAQEQDPTRSIRDDIILNHLLGLQILHHQFIDGASPPAAPERPVPTPA
jgi:asparagine synthase (glutamine-hydrolysing)